MKEKHSSESKRYTDHRVEPYHRNGRPAPNARVGTRRALPGQITPVTGILDRVHNELVKQLGDKYLSLLDEFRRQYPEMISDENVPTVNGAEQPEPE